MTEAKTSRRSFLKYLGAVGAALGVGALIGSKLAMPAHANAPASTTIQPDVISSYLYTGPPGSYAYTYNSDGTVASYTYGSLTVTLTYNADGTVATTTSVDGSVTVTDTYSYNSSGQVTGLTRT
jgi:YD repeat-containing protein